MSYIIAEMDPLNLDCLNVYELNKLRALAEGWKEAHSQKDYATSDKLRAELMAWGAWPPECWAVGWYSIFESTEHRYARHLERARWPLSGEIDHKPMTRESLEIARLERETRIANGAPHGKEWRG